jgi:hypothetical protein
MALKFLAEHPETACAQRQGCGRRLRDSGATAGQNPATVDQIRPAALDRRHERRLRAGAGGALHLGLRGDSGHRRAVFHHLLHQRQDGLRAGTTSCTIKEPLARVNETIAGVLKSISIQDLAEHEQPAARERNRERAGCIDAVRWVSARLPSLPGFERARTLQAAEKLNSEGDGGACKARSFSHGGTIRARL